MNSKEYLARLQYFGNRNLRRDTEPPAAAHFWPLVARLSWKLSSFYTNNNHSLDNYMYHMYSPTIYSPNNFKLHAGNCYQTLFAWDLCIMFLWVFDTHEKRRPGHGNRGKLSIDDKLKHLFFYIHLSAAGIACCVCRVLREPSPCGPPAVYRGSAEPQTGPHPWAWPRGSAAWRGSSWDRLRPEPHWSGRWRQYLQMHKQSVQIDHSKLCWYVVILLNQRLSE